MNENPISMKKTWRNPRQVIIHQAPAESDDIQRLARLTSLLATGVERLLAEQREKSPESVDLQRDVLVNTCNLKETTKTESR